METKINIMEIEKFAVHDGPGIRSVIFTKGCPLNCAWCANPESKSFKSTIMYNNKKCEKCLKCLAQCNSGALTLQNNKIVINHKICTGCKSCVSACITDALYYIGKRVDIEQIVKEVLKDKIYYDKSNGGVTISGGEVLIQSHAISNLIDELKKYNLHIVIETCGVAPEADFRKIVEKIDLVMFDLKHIDKAKYEQATKGNFALMMRNFEVLINDYRDRALIRIPVIPRFNENDLYELIDFIGLRNIDTLVLLPFHNLGKNKYQDLGLTYSYKDEPNMLEAQLSKYIDYSKKYNLNVSIGK